ncbi:hypothetical protein EJ03DRAFT_351159 [Teratosphaeria nubilosa]|uniref:Uncharacterized protein n=1 Tax=Teratosphaeria nubilosa TaxID=161662 RepID=A0A6G1LAP8_9PEZI|nr:hypothetical protein EJ03DRAFT_351159 [Teratosphaeria nubilosa]
MASSNTITASAATQPAAPQAQHHINTAQAQSSPCQKPDDGTTKLPPVDTSKAYLQLLMKEPYPQPNDWRFHAHQCRKALRVLFAGQPYKDWKSIPVFEDDFSDEDEQDDSDGEQMLAPASPDYDYDSEPDEAPSPKRKLSINAAVRCDSPPKRAALIYEPWLNPPAFYDWSRFETGKGDITCAEHSRSGRWWT